MSVASLCASAYSLFHCSLNRKDELAAIQADLKKQPINSMLGDISIATRWLSHAKPMKRTYEQYPALLLLAQSVSEQPGHQEAAFTLLTKLIDFETLLGLALMQPLMDTLLLCVQKLQSSVRTH